MGNFKIKVSSEAESKEAQELLQKLVGKENGFITMDKSIRWVALYQGHVVQYEFLPSVELNEITLPELRDMVVLKRNDVNDATHTDQDKWEWYISSNGDGYVWQCGNPKQLKQWDKASLDFVDLKPIEKNMNTLSTEHHEQPSLNDQYAEIEQVRQTLNERQSQYGEFANVAETTAMLMDHFIPDRLSYVQREALHMICSKLARIANGDPNHVDSWHDIAGYATLVVDDLES